MKLRVLLQRIRIMNDRDPKMASLRFGEVERGLWPADNRLSLDVRVEAPDDGLAEQTRLPRGRHYRPYSLYSIRLYSIRIDEGVFEGDVSGRLVIRIHVLAPGADVEEAVDTYRRELTGDPSSWIGSYGPHEALGPEHLGFWQVYYPIESPGE